MASYVNERVCSLILRTCDASNRGNDNASYQANTAFGTYWRWDNINLQALLGDLALKYKRFNLVCVAVQQGTATTLNNVIGNSNQDNVVNFRIRASGLNFLNSTYNIRDDRSLGNTCLIGGITFQVANNSPGQLLVLQNQINTFEFSNTSVSIEMFYERVNDRATPVTNTGASLPLPFGGTGRSFPEMCWICKIYPVKDSYVDNDINTFNKVSKIKI